MIAKTLNVMDEYLLSNPLFCIRGSKWPFSPKIQSQITGGAGDFRFVLTNVAFDIFILKALYGSVL